MGIRYALLVAAFAAVTSVGAQSCNVPAAEAVGVFGLADAFGDDVALAPFDNNGNFPWWIRGGGSVVVGVVENIYLDKTGAVPQLVLDARQLDGNDFTVSASYDERAQVWGCE